MCFSYCAQKCVGLFVLVCSSYGISCSLFSNITNSSILDLSIILSVKNGTHVATYRNKMIFKFASDVSSLTDVHAEVESLH